RGIGADGPQQGVRAVVGFGLHVVDARALVRHRGARSQRRAGALLDPLQPPSVQHRGGSGLGRPADDRGDQAPAGDVATLRIGQGRRGPEVDPVEGRVTGETRSWLTATRSSITTTTRATSGPSPRTRRAWGRGSWARPSAATS